MADRPRRDVYIAALSKIGSYDLAVSAPLFGLWTMLGVMNLGVCIGLSMVRTLAWVGQLWILLAPVRSLATEPTVTDDALTRADDVLQRASMRFAPLYLLGWVLMFALAVGLSVAGIPTTSAVPRAELATAVLLLIALVVSLANSLGSMFGSALLDWRTFVSRELSERGLVPRRPRRSIQRQAVRRNVLMIMSVLLALGSLGGLLRIHGLRAAELGELRRLVELSAIEVEAGLGPARAGVEIVAREQLPAALSSALEQQAEVESVAVFDRGQDLALAAAPLDDGRLALATSDPDEQLDWLVFAVLGLTLAGALPAALSGSNYGRALIGPIEQLDEATRMFVQHGELAALARIIPLEDDEVGRFASNFNDMLDMLVELARAAETVASGDLTVEIERPGELHDAFRAMVARLGETVLHMRETSLELASAATEIHALTMQQDEAQQEQSASVQQVSRTLASLSESARDIATTAKGALEDAEQAVSTTDDMIARIAELRTQTASIAALLDAIRGIAQRSDLLALNGSLEATRSGEAGRGFALVAAEMRRLAERVTGTVVDVRERLDGIDASGAATVMASDDGRKLAERAADSARAISAVTGQQSADTSQAAEGVRSVAAMVTAAAQATSQARAAAEGLRSHAGELERLIGSFRLP